MNFLSEFGRALSYHLHAFGINPISTGLISLAVVDIIVILTCILKLIILYKKDKCKSSRYRSYSK